MQPHLWMRPVDLLAMVRRERLPAPFDPEALFQRASREAAATAGCYEEIFDRNQLLNLKREREILAARSLDELGAFDRLLADMEIDIEAQLPAAEAAVVALNDELYAGVAEEYDEDEEAAIEEARRRQGALECAGEEPTPEEEAAWASAWASS